MDTHRTQSRVSDPGDPAADGQNMVVRTRAFRCHVPDHTGALSIRCAFNGRETYRTPSARHVVDDGSYLLINGGERCSSTIDSETLVESFCIFFKPGLIHDVLTVLATPEDALLDDHARRSHQPVRFFQHLHTHDRIVSPTVVRLRSSIDNGHLTRGWFEDQFAILLERLLDAHRGVFRAADRLPSVRSATRAELYRRLALGRDYIDAGIHEPLDMGTVAEVACLSYYHFLRLFRQAFGETPYKYLTRRRLERARHLLTTTGRSVTEICGAVGFESLGSFSWLFRRTYGVSPERYRRSMATESQRRSSQEAGQQPAV